MTDWYSQVDSNKILNQGDFIFDCPIVIPPKEIDISQWNKIRVNTYDVIIMSQSCDLENNKIDLVLVCPYYSLEQFTTENPKFKDYKLRESVRQGNMPGYHLLQSCPYLPHNEMLIIDFKTIFSISFDFLKKFKLKEEKRIQLNSPYKEHLSQSFARFFMRVGLPSSIPRFEKPKKKK